MNAFCINELWEAWESPLEKALMLERSKAGGEGDHRG